MGRRLRGKTDLSLQLPALQLDSPGALFRSELRFSQHAEMLLPEPASPPPPLPKRLQLEVYTTRCWRRDSRCQVLWPVEPGALFHTPLLRALHFANFTVLLQKS